MRRIEEEKEREGIVYLEEKRSRIDYGIIMVAMRAIVVMMICIMVTMVMQSDTF